MPIQIKQKKVYFLGKFVLLCPDNPPHPIYERTLYRLSYWLHKNLRSPETGFLRPSNRGKTNFGYMNTRPNNISIAFTETSLRSKDSESLKKSDEGFYNESALEKGYRILI